MRRQHAPIFRCGEKIVDQETYLSRLLATGESESVEFKKSLSLTDEALQSLCGMINTDGGQGTVVFGIAPDGAINGVEPGNLDKAQRTLRQKISSKFDPSVIVNMTVCDYASKNLLLLSCHRSKSEAYHEYDGRAFIREGTTTRQLRLAEKLALAKRRRRDQHTGPWKCDKCGSIAGQVFGIEVTDRGVLKSYRCDCGGEYWPTDYLGAES